MSELLFEIGVEEIPAGYIQPALRFLATTATEKFKELQLKHGRVATAGTPRRLTLSVNELQERQADRRVEHMGPAVKAGFDADGKPTRAAMGFAASKGVSVEDLQAVETAKGEYLMAVEEVKGRETGELLPDVLTQLIREIVFPKSMRWADGTLAFARPIQWLAALHDGAVLDLQVESIKAGDSTKGHRFMAPQAFRINDYAQYVSELRENFVLVDIEERRRAVLDEVSRAVRERIGDEGEPLLDEGLIATVTNLVEMPNAVCGSFDEKFLELPREALITSMREHQKYFPVVDRQGRLMPLFVAVNNTRIADRELAVSGHERVLRARLEDGLFFFNEDKKVKLEERVADLAGIVFQNKLGTMKEKTKRVVALASRLAESLAPEKEQAVARAARLAKTDLLTEMVGEFPSLQGVMGREYAQLDGEGEEVARAVYEHYLPPRAGGELPTSLVGAIVGLADRMDTLIGCFAINEKPTGTTDPFGLRRQAVGLIHILKGLNISLSLNQTAEWALAGYAGVIEAAPQTVEQVMDFIRLRFENDCVAAGTAIEVVQGVTSIDFDDVVDSLARIAALDAIRRREQFNVLAGSFKRIRNIIKDNRAMDVEPALLEHEAEKRLYEVLTGVRAKALASIKDNEYEQALEVMLEMKEPVDRFFDDVMVMVDDPMLRRNRLNLLTSLGSLVLRVGDISRMHAAE